MYKSECYLMYSKGIRFYTNEHLHFLPFAVFVPLYSFTNFSVSVFVPVVMFT